MNNEIMMNLKQKLPKCFILTSVVLTHMTICMCMHVMYVCNVAMDCSDPDELHVHYLATDMVISIQC